MNKGRRIYILQEYPETWQIHHKNEEKNTFMKNTLNQEQPPHGAEGVSMEAVCHMTARSTAGVTERNMEEKCHQVKPKCHTSL